MRILLEISNESYCHSVDAHQPLGTHVILRFLVWNVRVLQNVEDLGTRAPKIREILENLILVHAELLVRFDFSFVFCFAVTCCSQGTRRSLPGCKVQRCQNYVVCVVPLFIRSHGPQAHVEWFRKLEYFEGKVQKQVIIGIESAQNPPRKGSGCFWKHKDFR